MASEIITREMYNGLFQLVHNPNARGRAPRYTVTATDGLVTKPKGVTTILGQTLAKDFVGWAVGAAMDYLRERLPIITEEDLGVAANESNRLRDEGASTGTEAHAMVENYLKGQQQTTLGSPEAQNAYRAFVQWFEQVTPEVINVEEVIYSQDLGYAGTYDCMLRIDGRVYLCDLKTTNPSRKAPNGVYAENFLQLGAYAEAHEEQRLYELENGGTKLVPIEGLMVISAKKNGKLDIVTNEDVWLGLPTCRDMFANVVGIYQFMNTTTKVLGGK